MSASILTHKIPSAIERKLRNVRARHAWQVGVNALAIGACALVVLMMICMAVDWGFPFWDPALRWMMTAGTLLATMVLIGVNGWGPIRSALGWHRAAHAVDDNLPVLEERWSTVASLSERDPALQSPVDRAMAEQVVSEAVAMEAVVQPKNVSAPVDLRPRLLALATAVFLLGLLYLVSPLQISVLLKRFWSPASTITATQLTSVTGDRMVPRGEAIELVTQLDGLTRSSATLTVFDGNGQEQNHRLVPDAEASNRFLHRMRAEESITYRVRSGDGQTLEHRIQVIDYPEVAELQLSIEFPVYTNRDRVVRDRLPRRIQVTQGSVLHLAIKPVEPLKRLDVGLSENDQVVRNTATVNAESVETSKELVISDDGWYRFSMPLMEDVVLQPTLWSAHGLKNQRRLFSRIEIIADKAPVARVVSPSSEQAVAVDDTLEIKFEAHDDHGIATAELVVYDESRRDAEGKPMILEVREIPLGDQRMRRHILGKTTLDLKELDLQPGSEISYAIRVTDNRNVPGDVDPEIEEPATKIATRSDSSRRPGQQEEDQPKERAVAEAEADGLKAPEHPRESDLDPSNRTSDRVADDSVVKETDDQFSDSKPASDAKSEPTDGIDPEREAMAADSPAESQGKPSDSFPDDSTPREQNTERSVARDDPEDRQTNSNGSAKTQSGPTTPNRVDGTPQTKVATTEARPKPVDADLPNQREQENNQEPRNGKNQDATAVANLANTRPMTNRSGATPSPRPVSLNPQKSRSGQNTLTGRRRLKITERLSAIAKAEPRQGEENQIRDSVVAIDEMLAEIEGGIKQLVDHNVADADRAEQFRRLDLGLGNVESYVADLREQTKENQFAFVGLQMVDITRTHVTPARDRVFAGTQRPNASDVDATVALQHMVRAREQLAALLKRYERVVQEKKLKKSLDEAVTMYEVYVEKRRMLMREARQNLNPLERSMDVVEVDQAYLDRLAEVQRLRREMMEQFADMLGDDPRLMSRYLELVQRRSKSLRDRLTEIAQLQYDSTEELLGWLQIDESQKGDLWSIVVELRLQSATDLAADAAELSERIEKQMPLELDAQVGTAAEVIRQAHQIAGISRNINFDADKLMADAGEVTAESTLLEHARLLTAHLDRFLAALDRLQFEHDSEGIADYLEARILEARSVADQAADWLRLCENLVEKSYAGLVGVEQQRLAVTTQLLRVEMLEMQTELDAQFQRLGESDTPGDIVGMIQELHRLMESITFNQAAAAFRAREDQLESAARQQQLAADRLDAAEQLFDRIRREVVRQLDAYETPDPNIADLRDPTLDEFLARLEREPGISAQLGIPNRRRNIRVIADTFLWQQNGGVMLGSSQIAAAQRAKEAMKMKRKRRAEKDAKEEAELTEEQRAEQEAAKQMQQLLEDSMLAIKKQQEDPELPEDQRRRLDEMAEQLRKMVQQSQEGSSDSQVWQQIAQADQAKQLLAAIARGEAIPDEQWNTLRSTLEDGLWQVRGKQPPEAYRKAIEQYQDQIRGLMQSIDEG